MRSHRTKESKGFEHAHEESTQQASKSNRGSSKKKDGPNPFMSFLQDSGDWIADKYKATTESIGETAQKVGNAASEFWDVAANTDLAFENGGIGVETDLDEVMDLIPGDIGVLLDREASDNKAKIHFSKDGSITIKSDSIALGAVNINGIRLSNAMLKGVHVHIRRERNGLVPKINPDESQITINISSVTGENVSYESEKGPISATEIELSDINVVTTGKQAPFDDTPAGNMTFSVGGAKIRGFQGMEGSADDISVQNTSGSLSDNAGSIYSGMATASNMSYQGNKVDHAQIAGLNSSFQEDSSGSMGAQVTALRASATGLDTNDVDLDSFSSSNIKASGNLTDQTFDGSIGKFSAKGIQNTHASVGSASGQALSFSGDIDDKTASFGAKQLAMANTNSQHGSIGSAQLNDVALNASSNQASGSIRSATTQDASAKFGSLDRGSLNNISFLSNDKEHSASIGSASISGGASEFGSVKKAELSTLDLSSDGNSHNASIGSASLTKGSSEFGSVQKAALNQAVLSSDGTNHSAHLGSVEASGVRSGTASIDNASIQNTALHSDGENHSAAIGDVYASGLQAKGIGSVDSVHGKGLQAVHGTQGQTASIEQINANGINAGGVSITDAQAYGLAVAKSGEHTQAQVGSAALNNTTYNQDGTKVAIDKASIQNGSINQNSQNTDFHLGKGSIDGLSVQSAPKSKASGSSTGSSSGSSSGSTSSQQQSDFDMDALISSTAARVESGNIRANARLNSGKIGPAEIKDDTYLQANIDIAQNQIQDGSRIKTNKDIDTPLWTSVGGAYVEKGRLMGDINGFFDVNAGKSINKNMGLGGKELHSIGAYANAVGNKNSASSSNGGASSSSGSTSPDSKSPDIVDSSSIRASGQVQLSNGTIDAGSTSAKLAGTKSGDNEVSFAAEGGVLAVEFARFITSSLSINTDTVQMKSDSASVSGGSLTMQADKKELDGDIDNIQVEGVNGTMRN
jgi:hypothetical protein